MSSVQTRQERKQDTTPLDSETELKLVEALIFVSDEPITLEEIRQVVPGRTQEQIRGLIEELSFALRGSGRGLRVEEVAGGFRFSTQPELAPWIRTHFRNRNRSRLSSASIETLAVIAYKQPVTGPEIQEIRGVDPQGSIKTLLDKRLIRIAGKKKVIGRPFLYRTTREFLMHFGLAGIEDLPPIEDFERLADGLSAAASEGVSSDETEQVGPFGVVEQVGTREHDDLPEGEVGAEGDASADAEDESTSTGSSNGRASVKRLRPTDDDDDDGDEDEDDDDGPDDDGDDDGDEDEE